MKNKKTLLIISIGISFLYIILCIASNNYYQSHKSILECVHIIGPLFNCSLVFKVYQEKTILIYKIIKISSYVTIFVAFFTNIFILFVKKNSKSVKIISIVSIIFYAILIFSFMLMIFSS